MAAAITAQGWRNGRARGKADSYGQISTREVETPLNKGLQCKWFMYYIDNLDADIAIARNTLVE